MFNLPARSLHNLFQSSLCHCRFPSYYGTDVHWFVIYSQGSFNLLVIILHNVLPCHCQEAQWNWTELGYWKDGAQERKRMREEGWDRKAECVDEERNGVNVWKNVFSERKRESHGCRVWHCPSFTTVPVSPVALQHISTQLINAAITTIASVFEDWRKKKRKSTMMIHIKFLFNAVLSFSLVLALIAWNKQFWDMMAWWWN